MLHVALKSLKAHKRRLFTTGFAIILGVAFMSGTLVLSDTLDRAVHGLISDALVGVDAVVRSDNVQESDFGPAQRSPIPTSELDVVRAVPGVRDAQGVVNGLPILFDKKGRATGGNFGPPTLGTNWLDSSAMPTATLRSGRAPAGPDEVMLDFATARREGYRVGDSVKVQTQAGIGHFRLVGIAGLGEKGDVTTGARIVVFDTTTAQTQFGKPGAFDYIQVAARPGVSESQLTGALRSAVGRDLDVVTGDQFIAEQQAEIAKIIDIFTNAILAFGYISIFVGVFIIYNTFSILIAQRTRELALLRAVGAGRGQVLGSVLLEALVIGLVAGVVGLFLGFGLAALLKALIGGVISLPGTVPRLTVNTVATSVIVGTVVTVVSAFVPAYRTTRIPPVAAIGEVAVDRSALSRARLVFGSLFLAGGIALTALVLTQTFELGILGIGIGAGLIFVAVLVIGPVFAAPAARAIGTLLTSRRGITGRIARENAARNPKRTAATAAALTIGVALVTVIAVMASSVKSSISTNVDKRMAKVDLIVDSGQNFPGVIPYSVEGQIGSVAGVASTSPLRFTLANFLDTKKAREEQAAAKAAGTPGADDPNTQPGQSRPIVAVDPAVFFGIVQLGTFEPKKVVPGLGEAVVLASVAEENGWKVGDRIRVRTAVAEASALNELTIVATYSQRLGGAAVITDLATFDRIAPQEFRVDNSIYVTLDEGVSASAVQKAIDSILAKSAPAATVSDVKTYVEEQVASFDTLLAMVYVLLLLAILIAVFGIGNTISLSILERTRELGLLRAVGMERRQMRVAIRWESGIIAVFGTILGIIIGVVLAIAFVIAFNEESISPVLPWGQLAVILVGGLLAGIVAAVRPARRAARMDVLTAIATE